MSGLPHEWFRHLATYLLGLLSDLPRKSVEPIALASGTAVRTLQEFLADYPWDEARVQETLLRQVAGRHARPRAVGVLDESAHDKRGPKTPGTQRQYSGESGKIDNCVVGVHLVYTDNAPGNPFACAVGSDLYLPQSWAEDPRKRQEARIPPEVTFRPKWRIGLDLIRQAVGQGVRFEFLTFDEFYGGTPGFWQGLNALGQKAIGEVPRNFLCWATPPQYRSLQKAFAPRRVESLAAHSPAFRRQEWKPIRIKDTTRGPLVWNIKAVRVQVADPESGLPTDRRYWLIVAYRPPTSTSSPSGGGGGSRGGSGGSGGGSGGSETKYFLCNAGEGQDLMAMLQAAFARWHVERWFERAKQEAGLGDFEVRTYRSLIRHWLIARLAMLFLAEQTTRLRGKNPRVTFEQVAVFCRLLLEKCLGRWWRSWAQTIRRCLYHQARTATSYASRRRRAVVLNST